MQSVQKNINYGTITAGGNVHIGDKIYVVERDFESSILFLRIEASESGYDAMLSVKDMADTSVSLLGETVQLTIPDDLFDQVDDFQQLRRGAGGTMRRSNSGDRAPESWETMLTDRIFQTFFSGDIGTVCRDFFDLLQTNRIQELLVVVSTDDERIQNLPWEMTLPKFTSGGGYDLPKNNFGLIRSRETTLERFRRQGPTVEGAPLKMLFIPALPENLPERSKLLAIEDEQRKIIEAVRSLEATGDQQPRLVMEILDSANLDEITEALQSRSHDIVHISGHGSYVDAVKEGILFLENEDGDEQQTTGRQLGTALRQFSSIKLLVLSACETAVGGSEGSTAEQMAAVGLPAVLAMRFSVTDDGACLFTETLYTRLAFGDTLTKAVHDARLALWNDTQKRRTDAPQVFTPAEWFTPVLYQNQAIGPLLKPGQYNHEILGRFYPQTPFLAGKHTRLIGEGFIGRKRLLIQLRQCFNRGGHVCLYGLGGLGKTTTAEAFADSYRKRYGHDILIFRKDTEINEAVIQERIFNRWKDKTQPDESRAKQLKARLDDSGNSLTDKLQLLLDNCLKGHRSILIFDNFEDVQKAQDGTQQQTIGSEGLRTFIFYLLENAPDDCHVLFTTRYSITDVTDVVINLAVDKMTYAEQYRYVNFSKTLRKLAANERAILDRRIDGHPRALEFLEGLLRKSRAFDLTQFDAAVGNIETKVFETLLLDRVYSQLTETERDVFAVASVFFSRSPLAGLCAVLEKPADELIPILTGLRDWSLCFYNEQEQVFEVHALTRAWMRKQAYPDPDRFKTISYQVGMFFGTTWEDKIFAKEYFEQAEAWEEYVKAAFFLESYFRLIGLYSTAQAYNEEILSKSINPKINADALQRLGMLASNVGDYARALEYSERSLNIFQRISYSLGEGAVFNDIGLIYKAQGKYSQALEYFEQSLIISRETDDLQSEAATLNNIGLIYNARGENDQALKHFKQSLNINQQIGILGLQAKGMNLCNIGQVYTAWGKHDQALQYFDQSLSISRKISDKHNEGNTLNGIGQVYTAQGDYDRALDYFDQSLSIRRRIGERPGEATALSNKGFIHHIWGKDIQALEYFEQSLSICQQIGNTQGEATALNNISQIYDIQKEYGRALDYLKRSLSINWQIGDRLGEAITLLNMGKIYFEGFEDFPKAILLLQLSDRLFIELASPNAKTTENLLYAIYKQIGEERYNEILQSIQNNPQP